MRSRVSRVIFLKIMGGDQTQPQALTAAAAIMPLVFYTDRFLCGQT